MQKTGRMKIPFGIAQTVKHFETKLLPGNLFSACGNLNKWKCSFLLRPGTQMEWYNYWKEERKKWHESLGIPAEKLRFHDHVKLAHYADAALDIEFEFPFG